MYPPARNRYQNLSIQLVARQHPEWPLERQQAEAKRQWESAALRLLVETVQAARSVRPKARWGYYNYPGSCDQPWDAHMPSKIGELCNDNYHRLAPIGEAQNAVSHKAASVFPDWRSRPCLT